MQKVIASDSIIEIAGVQDTSGKLNKWANIIKWLELVSSGLLVFIGIIMMFSMAGSSGAGVGLLMAVLGIFYGFVAFFNVYMLRAFAIITEAASLIVLEHQKEDEE